MNKTVHSKCILCGSESLKNIFGDQHFITKCKHCSFVFSREITSDEELKNYYDIYPLENKVSDITIQRYNEILDLFEPYRQSGKLFEFGCGEGYFLEIARKRNWIVAGTEISTPLIEKCRNKNITVYDDTEKIPLIENGTYDIVVSIEVIEHLSPPLPFTQFFNSLLRNGGGLYMTTPNFNCLSRFILGKKWNNIIYPEHLCYYSPKTMKLTLNKSGFKEMFTKTLGISPARYKYALMNWKHKKGEVKKHYDYNEKDRNIREQIENQKLLSFFKKIANKLLNLTRLGESLKIFYLKK